MKKIVLINSESNVREVLHAYLSDVSGWQVLSASSPYEGLQRAANDQPDLILFDLSTFGMNFVTFLKKLRLQADTADIPVVLIAVGAKWLDLKPFQPFQVVGVIDYALDSTQLARQITRLMHWNEDSQGIEHEHCDAPTLPASH